MTIHLIVGMQNCGKTAIASLLSYIDFRNKRRILSNINLGFKHKWINKDTIYYFGKYQPVLRNVTFLLDEGWIWFDCRNATKNFKLDMDGYKLSQAISTYFFLQSSKDNSNIYFTSQTLEQTEIRIQQNMHRLTICERVIKTKNGFEKVTVDDRDLSGYFTKDGICYNDILYIRLLNYKLVNTVEGSFKKLMSVVYVPAKPLFCLYSTYEKRRDI